MRNIFLRKTKDERRKTIRLALFLLAFATIVLLYPKKDAVEAKAAITPAADTADTKDADMVKHKILSFNLEGMTDKGDKKWEVTGKSAESVTETEIKMDHVVAKAYGEDSQATITADKGVYDKTKNNVKLQDNVNAVIENTDKGARDYIDFPDSNTATAKNAKEPAKNKKRKTIITCDGEVEFNYEKNKAYFNKNVKVTSDDGRIEADMITVNLDPATRKMKEIVAEGNVKITRGNNISYSEKATYVEADKRVILSGRPRLILYQEGNAVGADFLAKK